MRAVKKPTVPGVESPMGTSDEDDRRLTEIERVYRTRMSELVRLATAIVGVREAGRDVVQEAFARAVRERASFRGDGPIEAWVWRIVVNTARSEAGRLHRDEPLEFEAAANGRPTDEHAHVRAAVALLPERQRLALFLRYYADLDYRTIADVLGIAPGTVAATLSKAHAAMRDALEGQRA